MDISFNEHKYGIWICTVCDDTRCRVFTVDGFPGEKNCCSDMNFPRWKLLYEGDEDPFKEMIDQAFGIEELV